MKSERRCEGAVKSPVSASSVLVLEKHSSPGSLLVLPEISWIHHPQTIPSTLPSMLSVGITGPLWLPGTPLPGLLAYLPGVLAWVQFSNTPFLGLLWSLCSCWSLYQEGLTSVSTCPNPAHSPRLCPCSFILPYLRLSSSPHLVSLPLLLWCLLACGLLAKQSTHHPLPGVLELFVYPAQGLPTYPHLEGIDIIISVSQTGTVNTQRYSSNQCPNIKVT